MRFKPNLKSVPLYCAYAMSLVALNFVLPKVPISLGVCFAMLVCGANIIATPLIYLMAAAVNLDLFTLLFCLFESAFLTAITFLYRRTGRKIHLEAAAYMAIALAPFVAFARIDVTDSFNIIRNEYITKAIAAVGVLLFAYAAFRTVYALMYRLCRCRLRADEILCICTFFIATGYGVRNLIGNLAYICVCAGVMAFFVRLYKSPSALVVSFALSLPQFFCSLTLTPVAAAELCCLFTLLFCEQGRIAVAISATSSTALRFYFAGLYSASLTEAVLYTLLMLIFTLAAAMPSEERVTNLHDLLVVKGVLPRAEEERLKERLSEKLFKTGEVFREIESAFLTPDDGFDDDVKKRRMLAEAKQSMCRDCSKAETCKATTVYRGFASLIEAGCLKGKVSFVDLGADITRTCKNPSALTDVVNKLLYEYRKSNLEAENARNGRKLLAEQAGGVAEVLKNRAVEFMRKGDDCAALQKKIENALTENGFSCPEIRVSRLENLQIYITLVGCKNLHAAKACMEKAADAELMLKDKTQFDGEKCVCLYIEPPKYDAAFGVAFCVKDGEKASGDTHSVIKINEHSFLMALSDGMGSGEYARRVSETAMSLMEAFCRAEMPQKVMLETINKLLCFNRDERFTCIDAATIDLNTLSASFVKIGSPVGLIVRKGEIKVLESRSLPLGILDNLHPATDCEILQKDDIVVFMSDGITSAFDSVSDLYDYAAHLKPLNPQALADKILAEAKTRSGGVNDDMTVLCVRVYERNAAAEKT